MRLRSTWPTGTAKPSSCEPTFYTGYLIIQSDRSLNVTTVQTAGPRPDQGEGKGKDDGDDHKAKKKDDKKHPQVHTISVTNVPERIRAESQQHGDEAL